MEKYESLDKTALLLGVDKNDYEMAKAKYLENPSKAIVEYLGYDDPDISVFSDFWYYYIADNTNNFFHNFGAKGYTKRLMQFIENNNIKLKNDVNFEKFIEFEKVYSETLFDILLSEIRHNLENKNLDIIGINIGFNSNIYYFLEKNIIKEIKKESEKFFTLFDFEKLEKIYGEIYELKEDIENIISVKKGDFLEKSKNSNEYSTLFENYEKRNYVLNDVPVDKLKLVL